MYTVVQHGKLQFTTLLRYRESAPCSFCDKVMLFKDVYWVNYSRTALAISTDWAFCDEICANLCILKYQGQA